MPNDDRPPSFPFYPRDWIVDTRHMSRDQRCRYHDALCDSWLSESYGVASETQWREWLGFSPEEWPAARSVFARCFKIKGQRWTQARMLSVRTEQASFHSGASKGGREASEKLTPQERTNRAHKAARARWDAGGNAKPMLTDANIASASASASASALEPDSPASLSPEPIPAPMPSEGNQPKIVRAQNRATFTRPTLAEVLAYCAEREVAGKPPVNPEAWLDHYESNGWRVGRSPMRDWKAAVRQWERNGFHNGTGKPPPGLNAKGGMTVEAIQAFARKIRQEETREPE